MHCNVVSESSALLRDFDEYLTRVRGLTQGSRDRYCFYVRRFLAKVCGDLIPD